MGQLTTSNAPASLPAPPAPVAERPYGPSYAGRRRASALSTVGWLCVSWLIAAGGVMQGYANETADALFIALLFLGLGYAAANILFGRRHAEVRAFVLTYSICVFV